MNSELLKVLCCPMCSGVIVDNKRYLLCKSCAKKYPVRNGIPDMRAYQSSAYRNEFNKNQARYEARLHDEEAETDYEKKVVRVYGTKTRLMVEDWAMEIDKTGASAVLDYGCGTGQVSRVMAHHVQPLFAFDISENSLQKNVRENGVLGVLANALYLPFKNRAFDIVCVNGVLHHIVDLERAISELARVSNWSVYVSEGIPRGRPSIEMISLYPGLNRKVVYFSYLAVYWFRALFGKGKRKIKSLMTKRAHCTSKDFGSKYERPLHVHVVESLIEANGFKRSGLRYYTNIDIAGDGLIKKKVTKLLVNDVIGTHFDLRMGRLADKL